MPGMPMRKKMMADIIADGGLELAVFDRVRNGETLAAVARTYGVGRSLLWRYLNKEPDRIEEYTRARKIGAAAQVEKASENLTDAVEYSKEHPNSAYIQAVRNDADFRKWHAGVIDRHTFGPQPKETVHVSIENLHLGALQALGVPESQSIPIGQAVALPPVQGPVEGNRANDETVEAEVRDKQPRLTAGSSRGEPDSQSAINPANQTGNGA